MRGLKNPGRTGRFTVDTITYASAGLNYSAVPALVDYRLYDSRFPAYITGRVDVSAFANLGTAPWPFPNTAVPLNGQVCIPRGRGPFPLVLLAHGNHDPLVNSAPGYLYLCELLASQGIIAATIDVNFLNGFNFGENDARAIVHLEHVKQFRIWNGTPHHPLHGRLDMRRILLVGHSRGGEGVGHASLFNTLSSIQPDIFSPVVPLDGSAGLGPYGFDLSAVAAIAPTDRQYEPLTGPTVIPDRYFLMHGSRDGDVSTFEGYNTYNRAHALDLANPTDSDGKLKALLWVIGANHNQFNSVWPSETPTVTTMPRADQERVAKVHLGSLAQALLLIRKRYLAVLRDHATAVAWDPVGSDFVSQYQDPRRVFVQHNQESLAAPEVSAPIQGAVTTNAVVATRQLVDLADAGSPQSTITLQVQWTVLGARFSLEIDPGSLPDGRFSTLAVRVGQSTQPGNAAGQDQDFTIEVSSGSRTAAISASSLQRILYPDALGDPARIVMQTLRLPQERLADLGVDRRDIRSISLVFDRRASGVLYIGDVQFSD
jgi:hypothetical protein